MHAVRERLDVGWSDRKLSSLGFSGNSGNTDDITSSQSSGKDIKVTLVVLGSGENLDLAGILVDIDKDKLGPGSSYHHDSSCDRDTLSIQELSILNLDIRVLLSELRKSEISLELMWIRVLALRPDTL